MGSGCCGAAKTQTDEAGRNSVNSGTVERASRRFSNSSVLRQRENEINRLNPTDKVDQWKEKLLMDIGSDPLAVFRDFPRMKITVTTPAAAAPKSTSVSPARPDSGASGTHASTVPKHGTAASRGDVRESRAGRPPQSHESNPLLNPEESGNQLPRNQRDVNACGVEINKKSSGEEEDEGEETTRMFRARNARVLEAVLQIAELCDESTTFGAAFETAWRSREAENASAYAAQQAREHSHADAEDPLASSNRGQAYDVAEVLDVHQLLQHACMVSGMLVEVEAPNVNASPPTDSFHQAREGSSLFPSSTKRTRGGVPCGSAASPPSQRFVDSHNASIPLLSGVYGENHSPYGTTRLHQATNTTSSANAAGGGAVMYQVRSSTFHAMQFMVQGVMFFPMQRFKHVLWMPWTSHYRDVDWQIFVSSEVLRESEYRERVQRRSKWEAAARANSVVTGSPSPILQEVASMGVPGSGAATAALVMGNSLSHMPNSPRQASATPRQQGLPSSATSRRASGAPRSGAGGLSPPGSETARDDGPPPPRRVLRIQHVQTIRNYVEEDQRRHTPLVELRMGCTIEIDLPVMLKAVAADVASASGGGGASSVNVSASVFPDQPSSRIPSRQVSSCMLSPDTAAAVTGASRACVPKILEEILDIPLNIITAHVEAPKKKMCFVSGEWKERRQEFAFVLAEQFDVDLVEVKTLPHTGAYI